MTNISRRGFLKTSGVGVVATVGTFTAATASAQQQNGIRKPTLSL